MIKTLAAMMGFEVSTVDLRAWAEEHSQEISLKLNENIEVLSAYVGTIGKDQRGTYLDAEASRRVVDGDMIVMAIAYHKGEVRRLPKGFQVLFKTTEGKLDVLLLYKRFEAGDQEIYRVYKHCECFFVSCMTIRGADIIVDAAGAIDTACGDHGLAYTPRVKTAEDGCLLSMFAYGDPLKVRIKNQVNLFADVNDSLGFALGVSPTDGGMSKRIKAISEESYKGNGLDIAVAVSIY